MTQQPPPYQYPPQYPHPMQYGFPQVDPVAPARRGGLLLIILGVVGILFGGCLAAAGGAFSSAQVQLPPNHPMANMDRSMITMTMYIFGGVTAAAALAMIVIGIFARRGSGVACILGIILSVLITLVLVLQLVGAAGAGAEGLIVVPFVLVGVGLFALAITWLAQGAKACFRHSATMGAMQQQQMYGGYPAPGYYPPPQSQPMPPAGGYGQPMQGYYAHQPSPQQPPATPPTPGPNE